MAEAPSWRKIEAVLVEFFRQEDFWIDEDPKTGDKLAYETSEVTANLTDLAKHLEDRL